MDRKLKREEYKHTKHDFVFSKWEILIGPNDWEDHASGKEGVERYRIHNLPAASSCPGLYELGAAFIPVNAGRRSRKPYRESVIVVYLGQADNVRKRLQEYGRSGSHLDHGNLSIWCKLYGSSSTKGHELFKDIFSRGYTIMFRWAPIKSKMEAEKTEIELLRVFDYAWNQKGNGVCRHADILEKLTCNPLDLAGHSLLRRLEMQWKQLAFSKRVGINIDAKVPLFERAAEAPYGLKGNLIPKILKFSSSQLQILPKDNSANDQIICGVATGHGSICINNPISGRKRCGLHKGKKITGVGSASRRVAVAVTQVSASSVLEGGAKGSVLSVGMPVFDEITCPFKEYQTDLVGQEKFHHNIEEENLVCGAMIGDGNSAVCRRSPILGRKRCEVHKGQRVPSVDKTIKNSKQLNNYNNICGVKNGAGHACSRMPVPGRKRCEEHKGRRQL